MWAGSVCFPLPGCFAPIFGERRLNEHDAAAVDLPGLGEQAAERLAIDAVFLGQDFGGEGLGGVGGVDGYLGLHDDGAMVEVFVHEMHGAAADLDAVIEGLVLGVEAGEGG